MTNSSILRADSSRAARGSGSEAGILQAVPEGRVMLDHPYEPGNYDDCCNVCGEPAAAHQDQE